MAGAGKPSSRSLPCSCIASSWMHHRKVGELISTTPPVNKFGTRQKPNSTWTPYRWGLSDQPSLISIYCPPLTSLWPRITLLLLHISTRCWGQGPGPYEKRLLFFSVVVTFNISIHARFIPGRMSMIADNISRAGQILPMEWSLYQGIANLIFNQWGQPNLDFFATRFNTKFPTIMSLTPGFRR